VEISEPEIYLDMKEIALACRKGTHQRLYLAWMDVLGTSPTDMGMSKRSPS
jgi:hypothetical protein